MNPTEINIEPLYELPLEKRNPFGQSVLDDLQTLITQSIISIPNPDLELITKAFYFCVDSHRNVRRMSGAPYYTHPLKVAMIMMVEFSVGDTASVVAALLHDTVEDVQHVTIDLVREKFSDDVALIVDGLTKIKGTKTRQMDKGATYAKLFNALVKDIRAILIKLADRYDNMRTLYHLPDSKQKAIAYETLNFYTPFAQRLGLTKIRKDLEDLSLYFIDRNAFNTIHRALEEKRKVFIDYIKNFLTQINQKLNERNVSHVLTMEHKHVYEIYKMIEQGKSLTDIDNFYSMVITLRTDDNSEAYRAYGIIANVFGPVSSLDDFIARPKINLYRALHSVHFGPGRKLVEVIIRTEEMDRIVEKGIVAFYHHGNIKKPLAFDDEDIYNWVDWMQDVLAGGGEDAIQQIWGSIKKNLYEDDILIHTKHGMSLSIPKGSCIIDLAFKISEETGFHCISAKVNGDIKSLDYELSNNDHVEIITSPNAMPSPEWQNFVITNNAVVKLHNYFKKYSGENFNYPVINSKIDIRLRVTGEDRLGMLTEIRQVIGFENIRRTYLYTSNSTFEALFHLSISNLETLNILFTKLLNIKGIQGIERVDDES